MNLSSLKNLGRQYLSPFVNGGDQSPSIPAPEQERGEADAPADATSSTPLSTRTVQLKTEVAGALKTFSAATVGSRALHSLRGSLTRIDDRYQQWMEKHVDPLLGGKRADHSDDLEKTHESVASLVSAEDVSGVKLDATHTTSIVEQKKEINRAIGLSAALATIAVGANLLAVPAALVCLPLGLYVSRAVFSAAYDDFKVKRKVGDPAVASLLMLGTFLGGFFVVGGVASVLYFSSNKMILITQDRSRRKLVNIMGQMPGRVWVLMNGQETEIPLSQVQDGDTIVVGAGQVIPVDGVVVDGNAMVDQHRLTGEAQPAEKAVGDTVMAATMVMAGKLHIQVTQTGTATAAAQIGEILNNTANSHLEIQSKAIRFVDRAALPTLLTAGVALPLVGYQGAVAITGASIGYNMRLTAPIAMLNYLNLAADRGILIKDGRSLELLPEIDTVIFDKTGTLTEEQPHVARIHCMDGISEAQLLACAAAIEARQSHPIAHAIVAAAHERGLSLPAIDEAHYAIGYGIRARIDGALFRIGSSRFMGLEQIELPPAVELLQQAAHSQGHTIVMVAMDDRLAGAIELEPTLRPEIAEIVADLHRRNLQVYIISGDQEQPTQKLAQSLGIDHYFANTLPGDKAAHVERLQAEGRKVCFVGDGINDSLALRLANVSISLRGATSVATDTAQIVMMDRSLKQLPVLLDLADEFNGNMRAEYAASIIPGVATIGGVFLLKVGIFASVMIYNVGLLAGVSIAMLPLLLNRKVNLESTEADLEHSVVEATDQSVLLRDKGIQQAMVEQVCEKSEEKEC